MKYFGVGLQKTGTTTLGNYYQACGIHRFPGGDVGLTHEVLRKNLEPLKSRAQKFDGFEDAPWFIAYEYLLTTFPNAKFILTVRSTPEKWLQSCRMHCENYGMQYPFRQTFGFRSPIGHEGAFLAAYETHNKAVEDFFSDKPDQFLKVCFEEPDSHARIVTFLGKSPDEVPTIWANRGGLGYRSGSNLLKARAGATYFVRSVLAHLNLPLR